MRINFGSLARCSFIIVALALAIGLSVASGREIAGTIGNDSLVGTPDADRIDGGWGNDNIQGLGGRDELIGGLGQDDIAGGDGNDVISSGSGSDDVQGGAGHDTIDTDGGSDDVHGGSGLDRILADLGAQTTSGDADNDVLLSLTGTSLHVQDGGDGNDIVAGWGVVRGGAGNDLLTNNGGTLIDGGPGTDTCRRAFLTPTANCETVVTLGVALFAPSLTVSNVPAENATLNTGTISAQFTTSNAAAVYCMVDTGAITPCTGSFTASGLSNGEHALAIVAVSGGAQPARAFVRHFTVDSPVEPTSIVAVSSPQAEAFRFDTQSLTNVAAVRAEFADGGSATWSVTDPRVAVESPSQSAKRITVQDPNLAAETITKIELLRTNASVVVAWTGNVSIASTVVLDSAASPAASTLRIVGVNLDRVDTIALVHGSGTLTIAATDPGVTRTATLITITSTALDGLAVTQIDAIRALDGNEVVSSLSVDITIASADEEPPVITVPVLEPAEATNPAGTPVTFTVTAIDAVSGTISPVCSPASGTAFQLGTTSVTCAAQDAAGNEAQAEFEVTVIDTTAPELHIPASLTVNADANGYGTVPEYEFSAEDLGDASPQVFCINDPGTRVFVGTTIVECGANDASGNYVFGQFPLEVVDVTPPTLELPEEPVVIEAMVHGGTDVPPNMYDRPSDAVGIADSACLPDLPIYPLGDNVIECTATDFAGNVATGTFIYRVVDTVAPGIANPGSVYAQADDATGADVTFDLELTDDVDADVSLMCTPPNGSRFPVGRTTVVCVATDDSGNSASTSFDVIVYDGAPPVIELLSSTTFVTNDPDYGPIEFDVRAVDAIDGEVDTYCDSPSNFSGSPGDSVIISCFAEDAAGNQASATFAVTIVYEDPFATPESTIETAFPEILEEDYDPNLPMGSIVGEVQPERIAMDVVDEDGELRRVYGTGDFAYRDADGVVRSYDVDLQLGADVTWRAHSVPYFAELPYKYANGMAWGLPTSSSAAVITPVGTRPRQAPAKQFDTNKLLYPEVWPSTDVVATTLSRSVKEHLIVRDAAAPRSFTWNVELPASASLRVDENDGAVYLDRADGSSQRFMSFPWAKDQVGNHVPVWYSVAPTGSATQVTMHWTETAVDANSQAVEVVYPIAIDPEYQSPVEQLESSVQDNAYPNGGTNALCTLSEFNLTFTAGGIQRHFFPGPTGARSNCKVAQPPSGSTWYSFSARLDWKMTARHEINLWKKGSPVGAPTTTTGTSLADFSPASGRPTHGTNAFINWTEGDSPDSIGPEGTVGFFFTTTNDSYVPANTALYARLHKITSLFNDDNDPVVVSDLPELGDELSVSFRKPGSYHFSGTVTDEGSGCAGGTVEISSDDPQAAPVITPLTVNQGVHPAVNTCSFSGAISAMRPGEYTVDVSALDFALNESSYSAGFTIVDPITNPSIDDTTTPPTVPAIAGRKMISTEYAENYSGPMQLEVVAPNGVEFTLGSPITVPGELDVEWDTNRVQNGSYTLRARITSGADAGIVKSLPVIVQNIQPMQVASPATAGARDLGLGFEASLRSGALSSTSTDITQSGSGGVTLEFERSYNSQNSQKGLLGTGWSTSFEQRLEVGDDRVVSFVDGTGRRWPFAPITTGGFEPAPRFEGQLRLNPDVQTAVTWPWEIVFPDGHSLYFDAQMRLRRAQWMSGAHIAYGVPQPLGGGEFSVSISDSAGHFITGTIGSNSRLRQVTDSTNRSWNFDFDSNQNVYRIRDPRNEATTFTVDANGVITGAKDPIDRTVSFAFTPAPSDAYEEEIPQLTTAVDQGGATRTLDYDEAVATSVTEYFGNREVVTDLNEQGAVTLQETMIHAGTPNDASDPKEYASIEYAYDSRGNVTETTDEEGNVTTSVYNDAGCLASTTDAEENVVTYSGFGPGCRPATKTEVMDGDTSHTTTFTYDGHGRKLTETLPEGGQTTWTYANGSELPATMDPPAGATITYERDSTGNVIDQSYTDVQGTHHVERATFDAAGRMLTQRQGNLPNTVFELDELGRVKKETDGTDHFAETHYDDAGQVEYTIDKNGNRTDYQYDDRGNQKLVQNGNEKTITVFDMYGDARTVTNALGDSTTYEYDNLGNVTREKDPLDRITTYTNDKLGNELTSLQPGYLPTQFSGATYDGNGSELTTRNPDGSSTINTYDARGAVSTEENERHFVTSYGYDADGRQTTVTNAENEVDETFYDAAGRVEARENGLNERTAYTLDPMGRVVKTTNNDQSFSSAVFDDAGRQVERVDERGKKTVISYDAMGRILTELAPDGGLWTYEYDGNGNRTYERSPQGQVRRWTYESHDRVKTAEDAAGCVTEYFYDAGGFLERTKDCRDKETLYEYDEAGQRTKMTSAENVVTSYTYTDRGELDLETRDGVATDHDYDLRGNLVKVTKGGSVTVYDYDAVGNLTLHLMPDGTRIEYEYDKVDRLIREVHSLRGATSWTYDAAGRQKTVTTPAGTTTYVRDDMGRVERANFPDGTFAAYTYDDTGYPISVTDKIGTRPVTRDEAGRVKTFRTARGAAGSYSYDTAGRVTRYSVDTPYGLQVTTYEYDPAGRLWKMHAPMGTTTYTYTPLGQLENKAFPGGRSITYTYDASGRLKTQKLSDMPLRTYWYDDQDRVTRIDITKSGETYPIERYAYTAAGQLATWWHDRDRVRNDYVYEGGRLVKTTRQFTSAPSGSNTASEDAVLAQCRTNFPSCPQPYYSVINKVMGNAVPEFGDPAALTGEMAALARSMVRGDSWVVKQIGYNSAGQVNQFDLPYYVTRENRFAYDARGNMSLYGGYAALTYYHDNTLKSSSRGAQVETQFRTVDGRVTGRTIRHSVFNPTDQLMDQDDQGRIIWFRSDRNNTTFHWLIDHDPYGINSLKLVNNGDVAFQYYDHRGTQLGIHAPAGPYASRVVNALGYDPYGEPNLTNDGHTDLGDPQVNDINPFRWGGRDQTIDDNYANGLYHSMIMGHRQYSPALHSFLQPDPLPGQTGTTDTAYSYVGYDPVNKVDPTGTTSATINKPKKVSSDAWGYMIEITGTVKYDNYVKTRRARFEMWRDDGWVFNEKITATKWRKTPKSGEYDFKVAKKVPAATLTKWCDKGWDIWGNMNVQRRAGLGDIRLTDRTGPSASACSLGGGG